MTNWTVEKEAQSWRNLLYSRDKDKKTRTVMERALTTGDRIFRGIVAFKHNEISH